MAKEQTLVATILGICLAICICPLGLAAIILGATRSGDCDVTDQMGLNTHAYLLGFGISSLITAICLIVVSVISVCASSIENAGLAICSGISIVISTVLLFLNALFSLCWFIIGAVILFRSNIDCINEGSAIVIFALVMWIIEALAIVGNCRCNVKIGGDE